MNRRGSAQDVILIGVLVFAFGLGALVLHFASNRLYDGMLNNSQVNSSETTVSVLQASKTATDKLDYWVLGIFIGLTLALIITGWFVGGHPLFMGLYGLVIFLAVIFSMILANAWELIVQRLPFVASITAMPITNHLVSYLPYYSAVIGVIGLIVMFAKPSQSSGGNLGVG